MADTTVHVQNISSQTTDKEIEDFFSFCGKISELNLSNDASGNRSAKVVFEKPTAAKTALLLDNTQLGPNLVQVQGNATEESGSAAEKATVTAPAVGESQQEDVDQEDKPRSRIVAEYLAHGYVVSDKAIEKAIALDNQHGLSARFTSALQSWDNKLKASEKAQDLDQKLGVTEKAASGWRGLHSYFEKAMGTPSGQKVRDFYIAGNKQVMDVHNEARRLADLKAGKTPSESASGTNPTTSQSTATQSEDPANPSTGGPSGAF